MRQSTSHPCNHYARLAMARVIQSASTAQQLSRKVEFDACHPVVHHTGGPCDRGAAKFIIESKCILCGSNKVFFFWFPFIQRVVCAVAWRRPLLKYIILFRVCCFTNCRYVTHTHTHTQHHTEHRQANARYAPSSAFAIWNERKNFSFLPRAMNVCYYFAQKLV